MLGQADQSRSSVAEVKAFIRPLAASNPAFLEELQRTLSNLEKLNR